jgi:hypothetical protein
MRLVCAAATMFFMSHPSAAERAPQLHVLTKSGTVFRVVDQKPIGNIKLNEKPPVSIMSVSFDPIANNLYVVDAPYLEHGGIFVIDAKSLRQKKFLARAQRVITSATDDAQQLEIQFGDIANANELLLIDRVSLKLGKIWMEYPWIDCLDVGNQPKRMQELLAERKILSKKLYAHGCYSRDGETAGQMFTQQSVPNFYTLRQIQVNQRNTPFVVASVGVQNGECAMNAEKAICWPWRVSKKSRVELIDLRTGQIRKVPISEEDAPTGPADVFAVGKNSLVLQVGNNPTDFKYYIASDATDWDLKPYDQLNKIKGEWLMHLFEIEKR